MNSVVACKPAVPATKPPPPSKAIKNISPITGRKNRKNKVQVITRIATPGSIFDFLFAIICPLFKI